MTKYQAIVRAAAIVVAALLSLQGATVTQATAASGCTPPVPAVVSTTTVPTLADNFRYYAATADKTGWTGADGTYSVALPDGRIVWLFSDTFLGPLNADGTRPTSSHMVNNVFVEDVEGNLTTITGGTSSAPTAIMPPPRDGSWYWTGDGLWVPGTARMQVIFNRYDRTGTGAWDWAIDGNVIATFDTANLSKPIAVTGLPSTPGVVWGTAILNSTQSGDGRNYIYGVRDTGAVKYLRIARAPLGGSLTSGPWQYRTATGWSYQESKAADLMAYVGNEFSVTPWGCGFVMFTQDTSVPFSQDIVAYTSCCPDGPFVNKTLVYKMPEPGIFGSYGDSDVIVYNAHAHAEMSTDGSYLITYNVNSTDGRIDATADNYRDPSIYRPRFIRVDLKVAQ